MCVLTKNANRFYNKKVLKLDRCRSWTVYIKVLLNTFRLNTNTLYFFPEFRFLSCFSHDRKIEENKVFVRLSMSSFFHVNRFLM